MDTTGSTRAVMDRLYSQEAEMGLLSTCMEGFTARVMSMGITVDDFYDLRNQAIWKCCESLFNTGGGEVSLTTIGVELSRLNLLSQVGSVAYLNEIADTYGGEQQIKFFVDTVKDFTKKRELRAVLIKGTSAIERGVTGASEIIESVSEQVTRLARIDSAQKTNKDELFELIDILDTAASGGGSPGVPTHCEALYPYFRVLREASLTVIAARPGSGKSSLALYLGDCVQRSGLKVKFFTLEMTVKEMMMKQMQQFNDVDLKSIEDGVVFQEDVSLLAAATTYIQNSNMEFIEAPGLTASKVAARMAMWKANDEADLVIIDYLQLMVGAAEYRGNRNAEISSITGALKQAALRYKVPIVLLSQLNRESEKDNRRPRLSDLRESGAIEQDANSVIFIHIPDPTREADDTSVPAEIIISKNRAGKAPGLNKVMFNKRRSIFHAQYSYNQQASDQGVNGEDRRAA